MEEKENKEQKEEEIVKDSKINVDNNNDNNDQIRCVKCGSLLNKDNKFCVNCGFDQNTVIKKKKREKNKGIKSYHIIISCAITLFISVFSTILILYFIVFPLTSPHPRSILFYRKYPPVLKGTRYG